MRENKRLAPKKASDTKAMTSSNLSNFNALGFDKSTNESAHASMELLKGNRGDNAYELWVKQPGNAGKTYEDYLAFNRQPATDAAKQVTDKMTQIEQEANGVISSTNAAKKAAEKATTNANTAAAEAQDTADHPTYIGADYHVYKWNKGAKAYDKTDIFVKGDAFSIKKVYPSISAMSADLDNPEIKEGDFVLINTNDVEDPDNAQLYIRTETGFRFLVDMSGAIGFTGKTPQFLIGNVSKGDEPVVSLSEDGVDDNGNPKYKLNFVLPKGDKGDIGPIGPAGKNLEFSWSGYALGVRQQGQTAYTYSTSLRGATGATGPAGKNLEFSWSGYALGVRQQGQTAYTYSTSLRGATGATGPQGPKGDTGARGAMGPQGPKGDSGVFSGGNVTSPIVITSGVIAEAIQFKRTSGGAAIVQGKSSLELTTYSSSSNIKFNVGGDNKITLRNNLHYTQVAWTVGSDIRSKNVLGPVTDITRVLRLDIIRYTRKDDSTNKECIGVSAQDLLKIFPEFVAYDSTEDFYSVDYAGLGACVAVLGYKSLHKEIEKLKQVITEHGWELPAT